MVSVFLEDTHATGGYVDDDCEIIYKRQIHNVYRCLSKRVDEFLAWIKMQPFYQNSVVVILGDHLYMADDLYEVQPPKRHAYNAWF